MNKEFKYGIKGFIISIIFIGIIKFIFFIKDSYFDNKSSIAENNIKESPKHIFFHINTRGKELFNKNCSSCHAINKTDGDLVGLSTVTQRVPDCNMLYEFIRNSQKVIQSGDPYFIKMYEAFNKTAMIAFPYLSNNDIDDILEYAEQSKDQNVYKTPVAAY